MGLLIRDDRQMKALTGLSQDQFDHLLSGFDHGVGHPLLLLCNAKAPNY